MLSEVPNSLLNDLVIKSNSRRHVTVESEDLLILIQGYKAHRSQQKEIKTLRIGLIAVERYHQQKHISELNMEQEKFGGTGWKNIWVRTGEVCRETLEKADKIWRDEK